MKRYIKSVLRIGAQLALLLFLFSCTKQELIEGRNLIKKNLKAPSTARFENEMIILQEKTTEGTWYFYVTDVHAQNSFGAMIKSHYCVVFKIDPAINQIIFYPRTSVSECSTPPTNIEIEIMKQSNFWGSSARDRDKR